MKRYLFLATLLIANCSLAQSTDEILGKMFSKAPPPFCTYGKSTQGVTIGTQCDANGSNCSFDWKGFLDNFSYLRAEGKKYQLINQTTTIKGDGQWGVDRGERVHFFDSIGGYRGSDKANTEGNAYKTYQLTQLQAPSGPTQAWVMRWSVSGIPSPTVNYQQLMINEQYNQQYGQTSNVPQVGSNTNYGSFTGNFYCSKMDVIYQQNKPHIQLNSHKIPFKLYSQINGLTFYFELDYNSKAIRENIPGTIKVYGTYNGSSFSLTSPLTGQRGNITLYPLSYISMRENDKAEFYADINDGTYTSTIYLGTVIKSTPPTNQNMPAYCAMACPAGMDSYTRAQCQMTNAVCEYRTW